MGIMIENKEIISALEELAELRGISKAAALRMALENACADIEREPNLFPRERVKTKTCTLR